MFAWLVELHFSLSNIAAMKMMVVIIMYIWDLATTTSRTKCLDNGEKELTFNLATQRDVF